MHRAFDNMLSLCILQDQPLSKAYAFEKKKNTKKLVKQNMPLKTKIMTPNNG